MSDRRVPKVFEEYSAKAIGLTSLRTGIHEIRESSGKTLTTVCVNFIWTLRIIPFRQQRGFITVASSGKMCDEAEWRRAVMRVNGSQVVCDLSYDPLVTVIPNIDLLSNPTSNARDGVSYELIVITSAANATIHFSNPNTEPWRSLEVAALQLATKLIDDCESETLRQFVAKWRQYCQYPF